MEKQKSELKNERKLMLTEIKGTPFQYATNGEKNYLISGKVLLETEYTKEETRIWLEDIPWEAIALLCQAITNQMLNDKK